jgi:hypothetical protein
MEVAAGSREFEMSLQHKAFGEMHWFAGVRLIRFV